MDPQFKPVFFNGQLYMQSLEAYPDLLKQTLEMGLRSLLISSPDDSHAHQVLRNTSLDTMLRAWGVKTWVSNSPCFKKSQSSRESAEPVNTIKCVESTKTE